MVVSRFRANEDINTRIVREALTNRCRLKTTAMAESTNLVNFKFDFWRRHFLEFVRQPWIIMNALNELVYRKKLAMHVMQYLHFKGLSPINIQAELDFAQEEFDLSVEITYWVREFKRGPTSCLLYEVTTLEMGKIHKKYWLTVDGKSASWWDMEGIPKSTVHHTGQDAGRKIVAAFSHNSHNGTTTASWECYNRVFDNVLQQ